MRSTLTLLLVGVLIVAQPGIQRSWPQTVPAGSVDPEFTSLTLAGSSSGAPSVRAVALQSAGKIIVAGDFLSAGGVPAWNMARLNANGTLDLSFKAGTSVKYSINKALVQPDNKVVIAGEFTMVGGVVIDASADLVHWTELLRTTAVSDVLAIIDPTVAMTDHKFYRVTLATQ